jgi:RNA polymerase sigma factor (TIGR02999 family)
VPSIAKSGITELLTAWNNGDRSALEKLAPLILEDLRRIAKRHLARERAGHSLQTTALVNEAYLRLVGIRKVNWKDRVHFFAVSARLIRHILVDAARARGAGIRGGHVVKVTLDEALAVSDRRSADLVALDDALTALSAVDPRKAKMIELRFFGGLSVKETAEVLDVAPNTVLRDWKLAKAWLWREMKGTKGHDAQPVEAN